MSLLLYGLKNCDSCRKAQRWLQQAGFDYRFIEVRGPQLQRDKIAGWLTATGTDRLVNRRSTTWRTLSEEQKAMADEPATAATLLDQHRSLIKRPLLETGDTLLVGFDAGNWENELAVHHDSK